MKLFMILMLSAGLLLAGDFQKEQKLSLSAEGLNKLEIDCGAGFLKVRGVEGLSDIKVEARIYAEDVDEEELDKLLDRSIELSLKRSGSRAVLISKADAKESFFRNVMRGNFNLRIDLTVEMPKDLELDVDDGSGEVLIENIKGEVYLDDGSGETTILNIGDDVTVDDGSGDLEIKYIAGDVDIDDGSGDCLVMEVEGDVDIEDGSGSIEVEDVEGDVRIDDGSGSIHIDGVGRDVIIDEAGSGSVNIHNVQGKIIRHDD